MIYFGFTIRNPFSQKFSNLWNKLITTPFDYKFIELQLYRDSSLLSFCFDFTVRQSHSGLRIEFGIFSLCFEFNWYDSRHWDYHKQQYEYYEE